MNPNNFHTHGTGTVGQTAHDFAVDESAILDGEQGIASRLHELPAGFVDFAHRRITELLRVADESDEVAARAIKLGEDVPTLYRRSFLSAFASSACGFPPHPDERVQLRRDGVVESALHNLVDAIADEWTISDVMLDTDTHAMSAIRTLRSVWLVDDDPEPRS